MGNYNMKNIMLGVGIGLVLSSMVNINISCNELTIEEIKKEAEKHNLIILTKEDIINNQSPADESSANPGPIPETPAYDGKISVNIKSGMSSEDIADLLKERGIIEDTKAFLKRLGEVGKDSMLKVGSYEFQNNLSYDDIINILTK